MSSTLSVVKSKDPRVCRTYIAYLQHHEPSLPLPPANYDDPQSCCAAINRTLQDHIKDSRQIELLLMRMTASCQAALMDESDFNWVKTSERACYWLWGYIRSADDAMLGYFSSNSSIPSIPLHTLYETFNLNLNPVTTEERFQSIIQFFDMWSESKERKRDFLQIREAEWQTIYAKPKPFKWLDINDDEQCEWVWNYIVQAQKPETLGYIITSERMKIPTLYLSPLNIEEKKLAIYAAIDLWRGHKDSIKLFFKNINRTVSQQKHRIKQKDKKPFNTHLTIDTKARLDEIARRQDKKIIDIIDQLINQAYDALPPEQ